MCPYYMEVRCVHITSLVFNSQRPASYTNTEINHLSFQLINAPELSHDLEEAQTWPPSISNVEIECVDSARVCCLVDTCLSTHLYIFVWFIALLFTQKGVLKLHNI